MPNFPCPNPVCTHEFSPEEVHSAGALKCPVCGQVFQFRAGAIPTKPTSRPGQPALKQPPLAKPVAKPAAQVPVAPPVPLAQPVANVPVKTSDSLFDVGAPLVHARSGVRRTRKQRLTLAAGILIGLAVVVAAVLGLRAFFFQDDGSVLTDQGRVIIGHVRTEQGKDEKAFKLVITDKVWTADNQRRQRLGAVTAWKSVDQDREGWFAVAARDYGLSKPREAELMRAGIEKLDEFFEGNLELAEKADPVKLDGVLGQRLLFKGQQSAVVWWGHMYLLTHHGIGYWLYVAAPSKAEAEDLYARELHGNEHGFLLYTERKGWREQPARVDQFASAGGALTITAPGGLFEKHPAKDQDEKGELYLFARYQKEKDNRKNADVLVLALDKQPDLKDAMKAARKYLEDKKQEESKDYKLEVTGEGADQSELGISTPVGNRPGRIAEYRLLRGDNPARFWIVAAVKEGEKTYVLRCECGWDSRQIWREEFQQILKGVTFKD